MSRCFVMKQVFLPEKGLHGGYTLFNSSLGIIMGQGQVFGLYNDLRKGINGTNKK